MKRFNYMISIFLFALFAVSPSCKSDQSRTTVSGQPGISSPGVSTVSITITPFRATKKSTFLATLKGIERDKTTIQWLKNNIIVPGAENDNLSASELTKGDTIQAKATAGGREFLSNSVTIANSPPEITGVKLLPEVFKPGDTLSVDVSTQDADGDAVTLSYAWLRNGEPAGSGQKMEQPVRRGDRFRVTITPSDDTESGAPYILEREIVNLCPVIEAHNDFTFTDSVYTYQVKASDPDGDALTYSLLSPQPGMTINSSSGLLTWNVPPDFTGTRDVTVKVEDGNGGSAAYSLQITIK